jgi:hypothetical protein
MAVGAGAIIAFQSLMRRQYEKTVRPDLREECGQIAWRYSRFQWLRRMMLRGF